MDKRKEKLEKKASDSTIKATILDQGGIKFIFPTGSTNKIQLAQYTIYRTIKDLKQSSLKPIRPVPIVENFTGKYYIDAQENLIKGKKYSYAIIVKKGTIEEKTVTFDINYQGKVPGDFTFTMKPREDEKEIDLQITPANHACSYSVNYSSNLQDINKPESLSYPLVEEGPSTNPHFYVGEDKDMVIEVCAHNYWGVSKKREIFYYESACLPRVNYRLTFDSKEKRVDVSYDYDPRAKEYEEYKGANTLSNLKKRILIGNQGEYSFLDPEMKAGGNYYFNLVAINCWGRLSSYQNSYTHYVIPDFMPVAPKIIAATKYEKENGIYCHEIKWEAVENAIQYQITCFKEGEPNHPIYLQETTNTSVLFQLKDEAGFYFYIQSINEWGKSANQQHYFKKI